MRISDWSSVVCSSDLVGTGAGQPDRRCIVQLLMQHRHPVIEAALVQRGRLVIQRLEETVVDFRTQRYACCRNKPAQNPALVDSSGRIIGHEYVLSVSCVSAQASAVIWL